MDAIQLLGKTLFPWNKWKNKGLWKEVYIKVSEKKLIGNLYDLLLDKWKMTTHHTIENKTTGCQK